MNTYKIGLALAGLLCFTLTPMLNADVWNQKTKVAFSEPVEVPGDVVLPAGTYTFSLLGSKSNRNIVRISNADGTEVYATILAIADKRLKPTGETVIKFAERPVGDPVALRAWFFPGDVYGHEFVYPHDEAMKLAKANNESVFSTHSDLTPYMKEPFKSEKDRDAQKMKKAPVKSVQPTGQESDIHD
jgi:hypothetical protein